MSRRSMESVRTAMATGELFEIYADESATDKHQTHMVYGGVCLAAKKADELRSRITEWKAGQRNPPTEFHWSALSGHRLECYKEFSRGALCHAREGALFFRSFVMVKATLNYKKFHGGDKELGFYKLWYQFLLHAFMAKIPHGSRVRIVLDERSTTYPLRDLRDVLNAGIVKRWKTPRVRVATVEPGDSGKCHFLQMSDVLTGAVSHQNNRHRVTLSSNRGSAKESLASHIQKHAGTGPFTDKVSKPGFQVWHFTPYGK